MTSTTISKSVCWLLSLAASLAATSLYAQQTEPLQHYWELHPDFGDIWKFPVANRSPAIDIEMLRSATIQDRIDVSQLICQHHSKDNFPDREQTRTILIERLNLGAEPIVVQRSMLSAACLISKPEHAQSLWKIAQADPALCAIVEPWLVQWKSTVAADAWRNRLRDTKANPIAIDRAIQGIHAIGDPNDAELLIQTIKGNNTTKTNRYLAAWALGEIRKEGLEGFAQQIIQSKIDDADLISANLIRFHKSEQSATLLKSLLQTFDSPAYPVVVSALATNFPTQAIAFASNWIEHPSDGVRESALLLLHGVNDDESVRLQAKLLSDRNIRIRRLAGKQLVQKSKDGKRELVDGFVSENLTSEVWTGVEQAIIVAAQLEDRTRCSKLVELLNHPRAEVNMHAGWALMELANDVETLASIHAHGQKTLDRLIAGDRSIRPTDGIRLSFLYEAIGRNRYEPAKETLAAYIPKDTRKGNVCRASAIWALGQIYGDKGSEEICKLLQGRVEDALTMIPEDYIVRFASILALGEMNYTASRESIVTYGGEIPNQLGYASQWTLKKFEERSTK